jgi:cytochrome c-type biogenesis protein CcmE
VARTRSPARLLIALSVAAVPSTFLLYFSIAGDGTPRVEPSELAGRSGEVALVGVVAGRPSGDSHGAGLRFRMRDADGRGSVGVVYQGSVPDLFRTGRSVHLTGELRNGVFVGKRDTLLTKCPSKYSPSQQAAEG